MNNIKNNEEHREDIYGVYSNQYGKVSYAFKKISTLYSDEYFVLSSKQVDEDGDF